MEGVSVQHKDRSLSPPPRKKRRFESTTTQKAVSSFFTPASKREAEEVTWRVIHDNLLLGRYQPGTTSSGTTNGQRKRRKIAAFDLDSTLIVTISGNIFSRDATDWKWWHISVPSTLKQLYIDGYNIAILTNQGSLSLKNDPKTLKADQRSLANFKAKTSSVLSHFDFPVLLLAATARDVYRKPRTGMWRELLEELDLDESEGVDLQASFFVGDAGGRAAGGEKRADHACSDRDCAANVGIEFKTPEEHFLNQEPKPFTRNFEPSTFLTEASASTDCTPIVMDKKNTLDIVIMCGSPGSGKSTLYWAKLKPLGYERINQDTLKTRDKCLKVASSLLDEGKSVAIDNTNADPDTRAVWVEVARKYKIPIRCVYFTAPVKLCEHNDTVRALAGMEFNPEKRTILPHSAFAGYRSRFKEPSIKEGFQDIIRIDFQFQGDEKARRIWSKYWI